jgi:hypothetical protein
MRNLSTKGAAIIEFPAKSRLPKGRSRQFGMIEANPDKSGLFKSSTLRSMIRYVVVLRAWLSKVALRVAGALF